MRKEIIILIGLSCLFVAVSFIVFLTRGENHYFLRKKLRIGAFIIMITTSAGVFTACPECYAPYPILPTWENVIDVEGLVNKEISLSLAGPMDIIGIVKFRTKDEFSFQVRDLDENILQAEDIIPDDGLYDESTEEFTIIIDNAITAGTYELLFYDSAAIDQNKPIKIVSLVITE